MNNESGKNKKSVEDLKKNGNFLETIMEGALDTIFVKDLSGLYLMINAAGAKIMGKQIEEIIGKNDSQLFPHDAACKLMEEDQKIIASGDSMEFDERIPMGSEIRIFRTLKSPFHDHTGNIIGVIGMSNTNRVS